MTSRRQVLKSIALSSIAVGAPLAVTKAAEKTLPQFRFSLNTSTIRGQKLSLPQIIELAARAGYDGFEPWMMEIQTYLDSGKSLASLKKLASDAGLEFFDCIGFPTWMSQDAEKSKVGFGGSSKWRHMILQIMLVRELHRLVSIENLYTREMMT